ncbi:hypothetical protein CTAYLR_009035 [Chrysophaeum taylorii]|uniref:Uncharacterized protein n=1 Tax=Chrysophaeum taylorii TaxID=2483200 RepID=A0AAD7UDS1_9STRA|nr:hypothetical protein CTAYLR_009035 [Chrysophaeum taylorii]
MVEAEKEEARRSGSDVSEAYDVSADGIVQRLIESASLATLRKICDVACELFVTTVGLVMGMGVDLGSATKANALAAALSSSSPAASISILERMDLFHAGDLSLALRKLDAPRALRSARARLAAAKKTKGKAWRRANAQQNAAKRLVEDDCAVSLPSRTCALVKEYIRSRPESFWVKEALLVSESKAWREIVDLTHPKEADFAGGWFLALQFGRRSAAMPEVVNLVVTARRETEPLGVERCAALAEAGASWDVCRTLKGVGKEATEEVRDAFVARASLDTLLWWHEELRSPRTTARILELLDRRETPTLGLGAVLQRLMFYDRVADGADAVEGISVETARTLVEALSPVAAKALRKFGGGSSGAASIVETPVVVAGDASASMDVAIRVSTIVAALLGNIADDVQLRLFNYRPVPMVASRPRDVPSVLAFAKAVAAMGATAPAAALAPIYAARHRVEWIVLVTDEEENCPARVGDEYCGFVDLARRYRDEINRHVRIALVAFREKGGDGPLAAALREAGLPLVYFRIAKKRPDLSKFQALLAALRARSDAFSADVSSRAAWLANATRTTTTRDAHRRARIKKRARAAARKDVLLRWTDDVVTRNEESGGGGEKRRGESTTSSCALGREELVGVLSFLDAKNLCVAACAGRAIQTVLVTPSLLRTLYGVVPTRVLRAGEAYGLPPLQTRVRLVERWYYGPAIEYLDASCLVLGFDCRPLGYRLVDYKHESARGLRHSGDQLDPENSAGDHTIQVDLTALPRDVHALCFTISAWTTSLGTMVSYGAPSIHLLDSAAGFDDDDDDDGDDNGPGRELCQYSFEGVDTGDHTCVFMCALRRPTPTACWKLHAVGTMGAGRADDYDAVWKHVCAWASNLPTTTTTTTISEDDDDDDEEGGIETR